MASRRSRPDQTCRQRGTEFARVRGDGARQRFHPTEDDILAFLGILLERALIVPGRYQVQKVEPDPTDDMFLACALEGHADYIVSRDPHLLTLKHFHAIQLVEPPAFVKAVRQRNRE